MARTERQVRAAPVRFETRDENNEPHICGYFAVYNSNYEIWDDMSESIAPGAFSGSMSGDIRALVNHDSTLVLGRTKAHTLELRDDEHGLWADISVNTEDRSAMDLYARVQRGDVDQCSIGFRILKEETEWRDDGSVHWTIQEAELFEVSACTFPAYQETNISARTAQREALRGERLEAWKTKMKGKVNRHGTEGTAAEK